MAKPQKKQEIGLLLHNIRSIHNVGSIFRTADAAGISQIYLTGYTPTPIDRFGREVRELSKVALGGEYSVKWEFYKDPLVFIKKLKQDQKNLVVIGIEQDKKSVDYKKIKINKSQSVLFIVGNEVEGIDRLLLNTCDFIAEVPMKGKKESLNVAVTTGIAVFRILNI